MCHSGVRAEDTCSPMAGYTALCTRDCSKATLMSYLKPHFGDWGATQWWILGRTCEALGSFPAPQKKKKKIKKPQHRPPGPAAQAQALGDTSGGHSKCWWTLQVWVPCFVHSCSLSPAAPARFGQYPVLGLAMLTCARYALYRKTSLSTSLSGLDSCGDTGGSGQAG
jgi:hypothetical protein